MSGPFLQSGWVLGAGLTLALIACAALWASIQAIKRGRRLRFWLLACAGVAVQIIAMTLIFHLGIP
jgi:hypothetical protein